MTKESKPICFNMDLKPYMQREQYYTINRLGSTLIPLHQSNFELAIREFVDKHPLPTKDKSFATLVAYIEFQLDKHGYQTKIFRSQTSFVHKTLLKIFDRSSYIQSINKSIEKLISPL